jgi:general stress protein 26
MKKEKSNMAKDFIKATKTLTEKSSKVTVGSIGEDGYPNVKVMNKARAAEGIKTFYFSFTIE